MKLHQMQSILQGLMERNSNDMFMVGSNAQVIDRIIKESSLFSKVCNQVFEDGGICDGCQNPHVLGVEYG
jgi:hypothetical protein